MSVCAPALPHLRPTGKAASVTFDGREFPLSLEKAGWRLRSRSKSHPADYRTGTSNLAEAKRRAKDWLARNAEVKFSPRRGGGDLETLVQIYLATPKRTKNKIAGGNISRLRTICRLVFKRELAEVTCREAGPDLWQAYQRAALAKAGHDFDLVTRHRENIAINTAIRCARCLFLPALLRAYRAAGLDPRNDAAQAVMLPTPYVPPSEADDAALLKAWRELATSDLRQWLTIGLARHAGLRMGEICAARVGWIETKNGVCGVVLRDRPEEKFWTKTGKPYFAQIIDAEFADWLTAVREFEPLEKFIVPDPAHVERARWFVYEPQAWLRAHGVGGGKPLHRLRGLYADAVAKLTADAVTARLAALRAAQEALGHTTSAVTERHYLSPDALR